MPNEQVVKVLDLPHCEAHRSPIVRRELLLVAETGDWQSAPGIHELTARLQSYADAPLTAPCADIAGGFAALRAAQNAGQVAALGGWLPDDVAAVMGDAVMHWPDLLQPLPPGCPMVYVPPARAQDWSLPNPEEVVDWARSHPDIQLAVDERWYEYTGATVLTGPGMPLNVVAMRSLTTAFGLDGLGVGYLAAAEGGIRPGVIAAAGAGLLPVARRAALTALIDQGHMREYVETRITTRRWLAGSMAGSGFEVRELPGPYLLIVGALPEPLRRCPCISTVDAGWLWAVGTPEQVEDLFASIDVEDVKVRS
jgi:hypothetical protein